MPVFYLIDFENVGVNGRRGMAIVQKYGQPRAMEIYHVIRKTL